MDDNKTNGPIIVNHIQLGTGEQFGLNVGDKTVYNPTKQKNWFFLDLETGRGEYHAWFPGCRLCGRALQSIPLYKSPAEQADIIKEIANDTNLYFKEIDNKKLLTDKFNWYKVKVMTSSEEIGYVKINKYYIGNIEYVPDEKED